MGRLRKLLDPMEDWSRGPEAGFEPSRAPVQRTTQYVELCPGTQSSDIHGRTYQIKCEISESPKG